MNDRRHFIGGSDAAAVLGVSKWKSPFQLYQEKIGEFIEKTDSEREKVFKRGKRFESTVIDMLLDELKDRGHDVNIIARNQRYEDAEKPFLACELDLELSIDGQELNGEIKTVNQFAAKDWGTAETDEMPIYYTAQVMHGLMVKPRQKAIVAALIGVDDLRIYFVDRDDETIAGIRAKEIEFWDRVQNRNPPEPSNADDLNWLYKKDDGAQLEADDKLLFVCQRIKDIKAQEKLLEQEKELLITQAKRQMGNAAGLRYKGELIATWKNNKDSIKTDWKSAYLDLQPNAEHIQKFLTQQAGARPFIIK